MYFRLQTLYRENPLLFLSGAGFVLLPVSNAVGQIPLYLASVIWLVQVVRRQTVVIKPVWGWFAGWTLLILLGFLWAKHPEMGLGKLNRLLIFPLTGAVTAACVRKADPLEGVRILCLCLIVGVALLGIYDFVDFPLQIRGGEKFVDVGNMTSPQFYMVGIMLWLGLLGSRSTTAHTWFWCCLPILAAGLLIHQKRGVWLACAAAIGIWTLWTRKWKVLTVLALLGAVSLTFPFVQARLKQLTEVVQPTHGGRMVLWNEVAPRMFEAHPWGMGYNGSKYEDFREILPAQIHMEEGLRHLHNNFLQIRLELGWPGVLFWTAWMSWILIRAFRSAGTLKSEAPVAVAFALLSLHLNGLVEYNFGDSEVLKVFLLLFGCVDVAAEIRRRRVTATPSATEAEAVS
jgi:O-antigen ligase